MNFDDVEWKKMVQFFLEIWSKASDCVEDYEFFVELKNSPESPLRDLQLLYIRNYEYNKSRPSDLISSNLFEKIVEMWTYYIDYATNLIKETPSTHYTEICQDIAMEYLRKN